MWIKYVYEERNYKKDHSEESDPKQKNQVRGDKLLLIDYHSQYMMFLLIRFMHESSADNN